MGLPDIFGKKEDIDEDTLSNDDLAALGTPFEMGKEYNSDIVNAIENTELNNEYSNIASTTSNLSKKEINVIVAQRRLFRYIQECFQLGCLRENDDAMENLVQYTLDVINLNKNKNGFFIGALTENRSKIGIEKIRKKQTKDTETN